MILRAGLRGIINYSKITRCCSKVLSNIDLIKFMGTDVQGYCSNFILTVLYEIYNFILTVLYEIYNFILTVLYEIYNFILTVLYEIYNCLDQ